MPAEKMVQSRDFRDGLGARDKRRKGLNQGYLPDRPFD